MPAARIANAAAPAAARGVAQRRARQPRHAARLARPTACCGRRGSFAASGISWRAAWYAPGLVRDTIQTIAAGDVPSPWRESRSCSSESSACLLLVRLLSMIWSGVRLYEFRLSRVGDDLRIGIRALHARHGHDSAATRADADDSGNAAPTPGQADVGPRGNCRRTRHAGRRAQATARMRWRRSSGGMRCPPSCARCFPASSWTRSNGFRCTRGRSAAR